MGFRQIGVLHRAGWKFNQWHDVGFWQMALREDGTPTAIRTVVDVRSERWPLNLR